MVEYSLNWIIIGNLVSVNFIFNKNYSKNFNLFCFSFHILVKSLEGSSAISHTVLNSPSRFLEIQTFLARQV